MSEAEFFKRAAISAMGLTIGILALDRAIPHEPIPVAPFGEPWLTLLGAVVLWVAILVVCYVARWLYLIMRGRQPT